MWRQKPDTEDLLEQTALLRRKLMEAVAELEVFVTALNTDTAEQMCTDEPEVTR